jgi:hypothetical protein
MPFRKSLSNSGRGFRLGEMAEVIVSHRRASASSKGGYPARRLADIATIAAVVSALLAIYLSSSFAELFPLRAGPSFTHYPPAAIVAVLLSGVFLGAAVAVQPLLFWSLIMGSAVISGGMFVLGFSFFDEWLAACLVIGATLGVFWKKLPLRDSIGGRSRWSLLFTLWIAYLVAEGIRGLVTYHNSKASRPILDDLVILGAFALLAKYRFPRPSATVAALLITSYGAAYVGFYLLHGAVFNKLVYGRLILEGVGGAGKAFATFPIAVIVPAAFMLMLTDSSRKRVLSWFTLLAIWVLVILSASRAGIFTVTACTILLACWRIRTAVQLSATCAALYVFLVLTFGFWIDFLPIQYAKMLRAFHVIPQTTHAAPARSAEPVPAPIHPFVYAPRIQPPVVQAVLPVSLRKSGATATAVAAGDTERQVLMRAAVAGVARSPALLLFGVGAYGYWPKIGPSVEHLRSALHYTPVVTPSGQTLGTGPKEPPRPPAWPVFLSETGAIGVFLLAANSAAAAWYLFHRGGKRRWWALVTPREAYAVAALLFLLGWCTFAELQDKTLLYLVVMPFGLLDCWGHVAARNAGQYA